MKVVITLDLQPIEVETSRHPTDPIIRFEYHRMMTIPRELIRDRQAHRPGTKHGDTLSVWRRPSHTQNASTTEL